MVDIDWQEFKQYKKVHSKSDENFIILIKFLQNFYSLISVRDIYETLIADELAVMMLEKKNIKDIVDFESYLFKLRS